MDKKLDEEEWEEKKGGIKFIFRKTEEKKKPLKTRPHLHLIDS